MTTPTRSNARAAQLRDLGMAARAGVSDDPVRLPDGYRPCAVCGVAVESEGDPAVVVEAVGKAGEPSPPPLDGPPMPHRVYVTEFDVCDACRARDAQARAVVAAHPRLAARYGADTARLMVEHVFAALTALGRPTPDTLTPGALESLLARLASPGAACRFAHLFAPVQVMRPGVCNPYPFAHCPSSLRLTLRSAYAATLADRAAASKPAQHLPPPAPAGPGIPVAGGCMFCGIGQVTRSASDVQALGGMAPARREVWTPFTGPGGAHDGLAGLAGHTCPECSQALARVGSIGQTAMARAFTTWLRTVGRGDDALRVETSDVTLVAWGAWAASLVRRGHAAPAPNETSWAHIRLEWSDA